MTPIKLVIITIWAIIYIIWTIHSIIEFSTEVFQYIDDWTIGWMIVTLVSFALYSLSVFDII